MDNVSFNKLLSYLWNCSDSFRKQKRYMSKWWQYSRFAANTNSTKCEPKRKSIKCEINRNFATEWKQNIQVMELLRQAEKNERKRWQIWVIEKEIWIKVTVKESANEVDKIYVSWSVDSIENQQAYGFQIDRISRFNGSSSDLSGLLRTLHSISMCKGLITHFFFLLTP